MTTLADRFDVEDDRCPPAECVVRTDLASDAEPPPQYCELCPLPECEWEPGSVCRGLRYLAGHSADGCRAFNRERMRMKRGETNANQ